MTEQDYVVREVRPEGSTKPYQVVREEGFGIEVLSGGRDGVFANFGQGALGDLAAIEEETRVELVPDTLVPIRFDFLRIVWPEAATSVDYVVRIRIWKTPRVATIGISDPDVTRLRTKLLRTNSHAVMGGPLAAQAFHVIFDTATIWPASPQGYTYPGTFPNRTAVPGVGGAWLHDQGYLDLVVMGNQTFRIDVFAYMQHNGLASARCPWWNASSAAVSADLISAAIAGTVYTQYLPQANPVVTAGGAGSAPVFPIRIPCPPNGFAITIKNTHASATMQWEAYVYARNAR